MTWYDDGGNTPPHEPTLEEAKKVTSQFRHVDDLPGLPEDDEQPDCAYCRGTGLSPYSIRDVPCPYCGGQG